MRSGLSGIGWGLAAFLAASAVHAQPAPGTSPAYYSCTDSKGVKHRKDRLIPECTDREQYEHNRDGSIRRVIPPTRTSDEAAEQEARERAAAQLRQEQAELVRRDRNLMQRYRNEEAHRKAREDSLESVRMAIKASEVRLQALAAERKPLLDEAEFYVGKALPPKLKAQIDANDASLDAQKSSMANQQAELVRVNRLYDIELDRLRRLWAGAKPGSMGPLAGPSAVAPAKAKPAPASTASR